MWYRSDFLELCRHRYLFFFFFSSQIWDTFMWGPKSNTYPKTGHCENCHSTLYFIVQTQIIYDTVMEQSVQNTEGCCSCTAAAVAIQQSPTARCFVTGTACLHAVTAVLECSPEHPWVWRNCSSVKPFTSQPHHSWLLSQPHPQPSVSTELPVIAADRASGPKAHLCDSSYPENKHPLLWRTIFPKTLHTLPNRSTWLIIMRGWHHRTFLP